MCGQSNSTDFGFGNIPALRLIPIQQLNRVLFCSLGVPLNILVVVVILRSRQLWSTRHLFWLAVTFFNFLVVVQSVFELLIFHLYRLADGSHVVLCQLYSTFLGCPYGLLLAGLTMASCDRYLALARPQFYHQHITSRVIGCLLFATSVSIIGGQTFPFWIGLLPIKCGIRYSWILSTHCFQGILSIACLAVQIRLFVFIRRCIHYYNPDTTSNVIAVRLAVPVSSTSLPTFSLPRPVPVVDGTSERICRLELRAAKILGLGILPFCLVTLVLSMASVTLLVARYCNLNIFWLYQSMLILRELLLVHLVYIPVIFAAQSREFRLATGRFCRCWQPQPDEIQFS